MRRALLAVLLLLTGCAYYNSMYNARRFTDLAEQAEREGRTTDANGYWGQVTVRAETLLARHPESKWVPEARVLMGRAFGELNDCARARSALEAGLPFVEDTAVVAAGTLALARCQANLGNAAGAVESFRRLEALGQPLSDSVRVEYAAALRNAGEADAAVAVLATVDAGFRAERMLTLATAQRVEALNTFLDSLGAADTTLRWDTSIAALGRVNPTAASALVDRAVRTQAVGPDRTAALLADDGRRLLAVDPTRAVSRLESAAQLDSAGLAGGQARLALIRYRLARATDLEAVARAVPPLRADSASVYTGGEVGALLAAVRMVVAAGDSVPLGAPDGDMALFLAAEVARDRLDAPRVAHLLFQRVVSHWPESPYAPKALLAALMLVPDDPLSRELLAGKYAASPYVLLAAGLPAPGVRALEDSLGTFAAGRLPVGAPAAQPGRPQPPQPGARPRPAEPL